MPKCLNGEKSILGFSSLLMCRPAGVKDSLLLNYGNQRYKHWLKCQPLGSENDLAYLVNVLILFIIDVHKYLNETLPKDGYCILGVTWVDLYPTESLNFILGEAHCNDGCAAVCFGHFEPQKYSINVTSRDTSKFVQSNPEQDSKFDNDRFKTSLSKSLMFKAEPRSHATQQISCVTTINQALAENKLMITDHSGYFKCTAHCTTEHCSSSVEDGTLNESSLVDRTLCSCGICSQQSKYLKNDDGDGDDSVCFRSFGSIDKIDWKVIWRMFRVSLNI